MATVIQILSATQASTVFSMATWNTGFCLDLGATDAAPAHLSQGDGPAVKLHLAWDSA